MDIKLFLICFAVVFVVDVIMETLVAKYAHKRIKSLGYNITYTPKFVTFFSVFKFWNEVAEINKDYDDKILTKLISVRKLIIVTSVLIIIAILFLPYINQ